MSKTAISAITHAFQIDGTKRAGKLPPPQHVFGLPGVRVYSTSFQLANIKKKHKLKTFVQSSSLHAVRPEFIQQFAQ